MLPWPEGDFGMLNPIISGVPTNLEIITEGARNTITIPLAQSEDGSIWVAVEARLWGGHWRGTEVHEFKFVIIVYDDETGDSIEIFDRYMAAGYLGCVRGLVMPCVCGAAEALMKGVQPPVIYRATYITQPGKKELCKHQMITDTIVRIGYEIIQEGTDGLFRRFWIMTRNGDA